MGRFERKLREDTLSRIESELPLITGLSLPKASNRKKIGLLIAIPSAAVIALGIILPISLSSSISLGKAKETAKELFGTIGADVASLNYAELPWANFKKVLEGQCALLAIESGYESLPERKIALALPSSVLNKNPHYLEYGNTLDAWFVYYGGCIYESELIESARAYVFGGNDRIPSSVNDDIVVGVYYEGRAKILDDLLDDREDADGVEFKQFYKVPCRLGEDGIIEESPSFGLHHTLRYEYSPSLLDLNNIELYTLPSVGYEKEGKYYFKEAFLGYDIDYDSQNGRHFHLREISSRVESGIEGISYSDLKTIALSYKSFYRDEVSLDASWRVYDIQSDTRRRESLYCYDYFSYQTSFLSSIEGVSYEQSFFEESVLAAFVLTLGKTEYGAYWGEISLAKCYKKGDDIYISLQVMETEEPVLEYGKALIVELPKASFTDFDYNPRIGVVYGERGNII